MGIGWSVHRNEGWQGQYTRLVRWHERMHSAAQSGSSDLEDFVFAFFQNCYYLRDWLLKTSTITRHDMDELFHNSHELKVCRDICNGTKHLNVTSPSFDASFSIYREYSPNEPSKHRLVVLVDNDLRDYQHNVLDLADTCLSTWRTFLHQQNE